MSRHASTGVLVLSCVLVALGFLLPLWPLSLCGVLIAALFGRWATSIFLGLLLDIAYGAPAGRWHFLYIPFTLVALLGTAVYYYLSEYVRRGQGRF